MLTLNEDLFDDVVEIEIPDVEIQPPLESPDIELAGPDPGQATGEASLILNAISDCAKTIDNYNMMKANLSSSDAGNIIDEIASEETVILGKLQALLKQVSPNAECIPDAIEGAEEVLRESLKEGKFEDNYNHCYVEIIDGNPAFAYDNYQDAVRGLSYDKYDSPTKDYTIMKLDDGVYTKVEGWPEVSVNESLNEENNEVRTIGIYGDEVKGFSSLNSLVNYFKDKGIEVTDVDGDMDYGWEMNLTGNPRKLFFTVVNTIPGYNSDSVQDFINEYSIDESLNEASTKKRYKVSNVIIGGNAAEAKREWKKFYNLNFDVIKDGKFDVYETVTIIGRKEDLIKLLDYEDELFDPNDIVEMTDDEISLRKIEKNKKSEKQIERQFVKLWDKLQSDKHRYSRWLSYQKNNEFTSKEEFLERCKKSLLPKPGKKAMKNIEDWWFWANVVASEVYDNKLLDWEIIFYFNGEEEKRIQLDSERFSDVYQKGLDIKRQIEKDDSANGNSNRKLFWGIFEINALDNPVHNSLSSVEENLLQEGDWEDPEWRKYYGVDDDSFYDEFDEVEFDEGYIPGFGEMPGYELVDGVLTSVDDDDDWEPGFMPPDASEDEDYDDMFEESFKETSKFLDPITHKLKVEAWEPVEQSQEQPNKIDDQIPDDMEVDDEF